jgi:hypothetical protein
VAARFYKTPAMMCGVVVTAVLLAFLVYYRKKPIPFEEIKSPKMPVVFK